MLHVASLQAEVRLFKWQPQAQVLGLLCCPSRLQGGAYPFPASSMSHPTTCCLAESLWVSHVLTTFPPLPISVPVSAGGMGSAQRGEVPPLQLCCWLLDSAPLFRVCVPYSVLSLEDPPPQHGPPAPPQDKTCHRVESWVGSSPRAFLDLSPRCSSEELLDRLFRKSVVTEAEVTAARAICRTNRLACTPHRPPTLLPWLPALAECAPSQRPLGVSRALGSVTAPQPPLKDLLARAHLFPHPACTWPVGQPSPTPEISSFLLCSCKFTHPNPPYLQGSEESPYPGMWGLGGFVCTACGTVPGLEGVEV